MFLFLLTFNTYVTSHNINSPNLSAESEIQLMRKDMTAIFQLVVKQFFFIENVTLYESVTTYIKFFTYSCLQFNIKFVLECSKESLCQLLRAVEQSLCFGKTIPSLNKMNLLPSIIDCGWCSYDPEKFSLDFGIKEDIDKNYYYYTGSFTTKCNPDEKLKMNEKFYPVNKSVRCINGKFYFEGNEVEKIMCVAQCYTTELFGSHIKILYTKIVNKVILNMTCPPNNVLRVVDKSGEFYQKSAIVECEKGKFTLNLTNQYFYNISCQKECIESEVTNNTNCLDSDYIKLHTKKYDSLKNQCDLTYFLSAEVDTKKTQNVRKRGKVKNSLL